MTVSLFVGYWSIGIRIRIWHFFKDILTLKFVVVVCYKEFWLLIWLLVCCFFTGIMFVYCIEM